MKPIQTQCSGTVLMVPPIHFGFNNQTGADNAFQHQSSLTEQQIQHKAMAEYQAMVHSLRENQIQVVEFDSGPQRQATPDAVFPNNWFSTSASGQLVLYPMATPNRQAEVQPDALIHRLQLAGFTVVSVDDMRQHAQAEQALEGTGVLVFDHLQRKVYAALSQRCHHDLLQRLPQDYRVIAFDTMATNGTPVYHTNVLLSIGKQFAVVCAEVIVESDRARVLAELAEQRQLICITETQMQQFAANLLQLTNSDGKDLIALSATAYHAFSPPQREQLSAFAKLLPCQVDTIEYIGGGSVRCMLAEIFLPRS